MRIAILLVSLAASLSPAVAADPPPNDDFADAQTIGSLPFAITGTTDGATMQDGEPAGHESCEYVSSSVWYRYEASGDGSIVTEVKEDPNDAGTAFFVEVLHGASLGSLTTHTCSYARGETVVREGVTYHLRVAVNPEVGHGGSFTLRVEPHAGILITFEQSDDARADTVNVDLSRGTRFFVYGDCVPLADGRFEHRILEPGSYFVRLRLSQDCVDGYESEWFDDVPSRRCALPVDVEWGSIVHVRATLAARGSGTECPRDNSSEEDGDPAPSDPAEPTTAASDQAEPPAAAPTSAPAPAVAPTGGKAPEPSRGAPLAVIAVAFAAVAVAVRWRRARAARR